MLGIVCLTVSVLNLLAMFFLLLLSLALVSLTICVTRFLLPIGMQKHPSISMCSIFQSNLRIAARSSLSCPPAGIHCNLHITAHTFLNCPPAGIRHMLLLRSNNVPFLSKIVPVDAWILQRGLLFLFVHWFNEGCCVEGKEIGEKVCFVRKVTRETRL